MIGRALRALAGLGGETRSAARYRTGPLAELEAMIDGTSDTDRGAGLAVAYRCIQARAEGLAGCPITVSRIGADGEREPLPGHPVARVLNEAPGGDVTGFELREGLSAQADSTGNAFAVPSFNGRSEVNGLELCQPGSVAVERLTDGRHRYRWTEPDGSVRVLLPGEIVHLRHRSRDGLHGLGPVQQAREAVALALAQQETATRFTRNGFQPSGALVFPDPVSNESMANFKNVFEQRFSGPRNAGRIMVLDGGVEWRQLSFNSADAEFLESRRRSDLEVARIFGVPPTVAGIPDHATYSNVTQENRAFVTRCLAPWARRIEAALAAALLTPDQRRTLTIEHDLSGLLRGDIEARYGAYRIGREGGWLSANDIRRMEGLPPIEGGDAYLRPLNMATAEQDAAPAEGAGDA